MQLCNGVNQKEYHLIIIVIKVNLYFLSSKNTPQEFIAA